MATVVKEKLVVDAVSNKFGDGAIKVGEEWINFNSGVNVPVTDLQKGGTYEFEIAISEKGKSKGRRYINKVLSLQDSAAQYDPLVKSSNGEELAKEAVSLTSEIKKVDWAAKDRAMAAGGILHDAAALVSATVNKGNTIGSYDEVAKAVQEIAVRLVAVKRAVEEKLK